MAVNTRYRDKDGDFPNDPAFRVIHNANAGLLDRKNYNS
jgi:hypothetical protein